MYVTWIEEENTYKDSCSDSLPPSFVSEKDEGFLSCLCLKEHSTLKTTFSQEKCTNSFYMFLFKIVEAELHGAREGEAIQAPPLCIDMRPT